MASNSVAPVIAGRLSGFRWGRGMGFWMVGGELGRTLGPLVIVTTVGVLTMDGVPLLMILGFAASFLISLRHRRVPLETPRQQAVQPWGPVLGRMKSLM